MKNSSLTKPLFIKSVLIFGLIPILFFPAATFNINSQEWWLPAILVLMGLVGLVQILRKSNAPWPMYLISFAHGFNIISRLLMFMPQAANDVNDVMTVDGVYIVLTLVSMVISGIILAYVELPEVKQQLAQ